MAYLPQRWDVAATFTVAEVIALGRYALPPAPTPVAEVVALLNEIFQLVTDRILQQGGTIDKFIGDSVMAYFGAPVPHADHTQRAGFVFATGASAAEAEQRAVDGVARVAIVTQPEGGN